MARKTLRLVGLILLLLSALLSPAAREASPIVLTAENLKHNKPFSLDKLPWRFQAGDDAAWANPRFDDSGWKLLETPVIKPENFPAGNWDGRAWLRLRFTVEEALLNNNFALAVGQTGASEVYLDGKQIAVFGTIKETGEFEFNPNGLPVVFRLETGGEHVLAVRLSNSAFADKDSWKVRWLTGGGIYPRFSASVKLVENATRATLEYANGASMRTGFFFIGILVGLAFLHFVLYIFYRADRANLFYSFFATAFAVTLICGNLRAFGHQGAMSNAILRIIAIVALGAMFVALLAFLRAAFEATLGRAFWLLAALWLLAAIFNIIYLNSFGAFRLLTNIAIFLSFSYGIFLVIRALRQKRADAWIILLGVQIFALGMLSTLINQFALFNVPAWVFPLGEIALLLAVPVAVSVFLARNIARTNRDLKIRLAQVETLSAQKIEHERRAAELHAENERRAKELEEARQLQLSMLPAKLPEVRGLNIAAYMKPATEVGGDYYDFHLAEDGTLTVAVGDATGHGLKAGSVVTATKSLFNAFAGEPDIPRVLRETSAALKKMNLRGLFMAMTLLKLKDNSLRIAAAGMPSTLVYRAAEQTVEEINIRAVPLGGMTNVKYREQEITLETGDCVLVMSDGFPEMFNPENEMLGFDKGAQILPQIAQHPAREIIEHLVKTGENWAGGRAADDDVTFVVLKVV